MNIINLEETWDLRIREMQWRVDQLKAWRKWWEDKKHILPDETKIAWQNAIMNYKVPDLDL